MLITVTSSERSWKHFWLYLKMEISLDLKIENLNLIFSNLPYQLNANSIYFKNVRSLF
jgi:hypothetical protein